MNSVRTHSRAKKDTALSSTACCLRSRPPRALALRCLAPALALALLSGAILPLVSACSSVNPDAGQNERGSIQLGLRGELNGATYHLVATFYVDGPEDVVLETMLHEPSLIRDLQPGVYSITVDPNFQIVRDTPTEFVPVPGQLRSAGTQTFQITSGATTRIAYRFAIGDGTVEFVPGSLQVDVQFTESDGSICTVAQEPCTAPACAGETRLSPHALRSEWQPSAIAVSDFDADGLPDLVYASVIPPTVSVRRNRGGRQFDPATTYTPSWNDSYITSIATADFDGDGAPDVAMADPGADRVSVMRNEGGGALGAPEDYALTGAGPREIAVADIDGDGANDLLTADATSASVSVLFNDGFGRFLAPIRFETPGSVTNEASFATGDFNGDGWVDVALANWQDAELHILLNQSDGTLAAVARHPTGGSYPSAVAAADLNQDGALDLAVSNLYGDNVAVFSNRGDGSFDSPTIYLLHLRQPWRMIATDMNSDGAADLVLANSFSNDLSILENQGGGLFGPIETYPAGIAPLTIAAADLDRNGRTDLALVDAGTAHRGDSTITVLSNHCETP